MNEIWSQIHFGGLGGPEMIKNGDNLNFPIDFHVDCPLDACSDLVTGPAFGQAEGLAFGKAE